MALPQFFSWNLGILLLKERKKGKEKKMRKGKKMWEEKGNKKTGRGRR